jgi:hypothetical protein
MLLFFAVTLTASLTQAQNSDSLNTSSSLDIDKEFTAQDIVYDHPITGSDINNQTAAQGDSKDNLNLESSQTFKFSNAVYNVRVSPSNPDDVKILEFMTPEQIQTFIQRRNSYMWYFVHILNSDGVGLSAMGLTAITGEKLRKHYYKVIRKSAYEKLSPEEKQTLNEINHNWGQAHSLGRNIMEKLITQFNDMLWKSALVIAASNEVGFYFSLAGVGVTFPKLRGRHFEIGISFGYNEVTKTAVARISFGRENAKQTLSALPYWAMGLNTKMSVYTLRNSENTFYSQHAGRSYYPPGPPGYFSISNKMAQAGYASTWGAPGSDFAGYVMETNYKNFKILSIGVPEKIRSFFADKPQKFKNLSMGLIRSSMDFFKSRSAKARICEATFAN